MTKNFKQIQYDHQENVYMAHPEWFCNDKRFGKFRGNSYADKKDTGRFILDNPMNNLFDCLRTQNEEDKFNVIRYFRENDIKWWLGASPSGHMCSSQISCINHLFPIRYDREAVLALANSIAEDIQFDDVIEIGCDKVMPGYIAFEVVTSRDYLHESKNGKLSRGSQCTSVDAVILAKRKDDVFVLPIEWKFVEEYYRDDKSQGNSGDKRIANYFTSGLVPNSKQIVYNDRQQIKGSVFFQEPFYQLMRQTLWAEQVVKNKDVFFHCASDYIHIHVVPDANFTLRDKVYKNVEWDKGKGMVATWKKNLSEPEKYVCIDPKNLFKGIQEDKELSTRYSTLLTYLEERYWK